MIPIEDKITIDKETLKAIASDTRLDIIKQLDRKKQTLSDLSKSLKLSGPTIKEHLEVLANAGLVKKEESFRKWKYYSLTFKGRKLLRPNETKLFLALIVSLFVGLGIFVFLGLFSGMGSVVSRNSTQLNSADMVTTSSVDNPVIISGEYLETQIADTTTPKQKIIEEPINVIQKPLFNSGYFVLAIVILIIFLIFVLYINVKQKYK
ncbi:MAG TPA: winged helix-turn-helix domain-containing protein [archaeon]|nr:winged helix-turn-helix domain-containing protein [archaeon]